MSLSLFALFAGASALFVWFGLFLIFPACQHSLYRYKLWRLHDEVTDDVLDGRLADHPAVKELLAFIEGGIRNAEEQTVTRLILAVMTMARVSRRVEKASLDGLTGDEFRLLQEYESRFWRATLAHLFFSSLTGWVLFPLAAMALTLSGRFLNLMRRAVRAVETTAREKSDAFPPSQSPILRPALYEE